MTTLVRRSDPFADAPAGFNRPVAEAVYGAIMKCDSDDEARVLSSVLLGEMLSHELVVHGQEISKALRAHSQRQAVEIGKGLLATAVGQARSGGDPTPALEALETLDEVSKIAAYDPTMWSSEQRAEQARRQKRDLLSGRFVQEHKQIVHLPSEKPLHDRDAALLGIPGAVVGLTNRQKVEYQRGYREVQDMLDRYSGFSPKTAALHLNYATGPVDVIDYPEGGKLRVRGTHPRTGVIEQPGIDPRRKLVSAQLSVLPSTDLQGPGVQARFGDALGTGGLLNNQSWDVNEAGSLADELTRTTPEEQYTPGARALRRVGALTEAIHTSIDNERHPRLSLALKVGQKAGELGPEAQKVIGPAADRAAYRYRGTERKSIDERLRHAFSSVLGPNKREALVHGTLDSQGNWEPEGVLRYFRARLPRADLNTLQRKSGTIPPSEGVIVDKSGKPVVQAVGYADDHYLPFNLKNLAKLRGGEYLRTRTFGGPTTEDIYTGLIGGARSMTVVSHNGVYTVELDDDLKGGRRFNDKAARMVARYGQLLDAVKSEQVTTGGIHPARMEELRNQAEHYANPEREPERYEAELDRLKAVEHRKPMLSERQRQEITAEFFNEHAARFTTPDGKVMTGQELAQQHVRSKALATLQNAGLTQAQITPGAIRDVESRLRAQLEVPDPVQAGKNLAESLGVERQLATYTSRKEEEYKKGLTPLKLNSQGYELALTALQEQFPYYIKRVDFHPWTDATGDAFDTGYVMPRHNRPYKALAGYFDEKILGHGKVRASSVRNQNYQVGRGRLDHVLKPKEREAPGAAGTAGATAATVDPQVAAFQKQEAARNLLAAFHGSTTFSAHAAVPNADVGSPGIANQDIRAIANSSEGFKRLAPNLHRLFTVPQETLADQLAQEPEKVYATLTGALRENQSGNYVDIAPEVRRSYQNEGRYQRPKAIDAQQAASHLSDPPGTEYDIPGLAFDQDARTPASAVDDTYKADPTVDSLLKEEGFPSSLAEGNEFEAAARSLRTRLISERAELMRWRARRDAGGYAGPTPVEEHVLQRKAEGLLHAQQLRRRFTEAVQREALVARPTAESEAEVRHVVHHQGEYDEQGAASLGLPPARNRTI